MVKQRSGGPNAKGSCPEQHRGAPARGDFREYNDMICATTREEVEAWRKTFVPKNHSVLRSVPLI
jgi:hypothetical protein